MVKPRHRCLLLILNLACLFYSTKPQVVAFTPIDRWETEQLLDDFNEIIEEKRLIDSNGDETDEIEIKLSKRTPALFQNSERFFDEDYFQRIPRSGMVWSKKQRKYRKRGPMRRKDFFNYLPGYGSIDMSTSLLRNLHRSKLRSRSPLFG